MNNKKTNLNYTLFIIYLYVFVFSPLINNYFSIIQYFDELISIFSICIIIFIIIQNKEQMIIKKSTLIIIICLTLMGIIGIFSNYFYKYQIVKNIIVDIILILKFFLVYYLSNNIFKNQLIIKFRKNLIINIRIITILLFSLTLANYMFFIFPSDGYSFGVRSNQLFYSHATYLAAICIYLYSLSIYINKKIMNLDSFLLLIILLSTVRAKAIGAVFAIIIVSTMIVKSKRKISISKLGILSIVLFILGYDKISFYFFEIDDSARSHLLATCFKIAKDYFPLGTGFATFGSFYSTEPYSPVYLKYGLNTVYGLSYGNSMFVSDSFWPMILGQFGCFGLCFYIIAIIQIFKRIQNDFDEGNIYIYISKLVCFIYLIISSTSESAFVNSIAIPLALIMGINYKSDKISY